MTDQEIEKEVKRLSGEISIVLRRVSREAAEAMRERAAQQVKKFPALAQRVRAIKL